MVALEQGCLVVVLATPAGHGEGVKRAKQNRPAGADWSRGRWRATPARGPAGRPPDVPWPPTLSHVGAAGVHGGGGGRAHAGAGVRGPARGGGHVYQTLPNRLRNLKTYGNPHRAFGKICW